MLPTCLKTSHLNFTDALFTATSAVCVTGLTVVDTGSTFSIWGQSVILLLIQIGGIGIMVLSTIFLLSLGKKIGMTGRSLINETYSFSQGNATGSLILNIVKFTLFIETTGAVILFFRFYPEMPMQQAIFSSIFHSISAFCNAGFSFFSNSFTDFREDWIINLDICFLIIFGGIGFVVLSEIKNNFSIRHRFWSFLSLHTKLVISSTLLLLAISTTIILLLERHNTLSEIGFQNGFLVSLFHAVNARTAGFNTIQIGEMTNESLFITAILMFIGASPGSCGGGVKVTSFSIIILLGVQRFAGYKHPQIFKRQISEESISKAISLILISLFIIVISVIMLMQFEIGEVSHNASRGLFLEMLFETVSAFGTVGLSTGVTSGLSIAGKLLICVVMFVGRLGPLVIAVAVSRQERERHYNFANENIMIG